MDQSQDGQGRRLHRFRPQRRPLRKAFRQGRQSERDPAVGQAGPAGELARAAGVGRHAFVQKPSDRTEKPAAKSAEASPKKTAGSTAEAIRAAAAAKPNGHERALPGDFGVGVKIRYKDNGGWVTGTLKSLEPAVLVLDDHTQISTTENVLRDAIAEGLIVPRVAG